jgi:hypothetical protein
MVFLDGPTRMSDAIFIGGWAATDEKPPTPWIELEHDGVKYLLPLPRAVSQLGCISLSSFRAFELSLVELRGQASAANDRDIGRCGSISYSPITTRTACTVSKTM